MWFNVDVSLYFFKLTQGYLMEVIGMNILRDKKILTPLMSVC